MRLPRPRLPFRRLAALPFRLRVGTRFGRLWQHGRSAQRADAGPGGPGAEGYMAVVLVADVMPTSP